LEEASTVVLDVGKTLSKLTFWSADGQLHERRTYRNRQFRDVPYAALDASGIEAWLAETLSDFARMGRVGAIVPVAHGAAAALIRDGKLAVSPIDYEQPIDENERQAYDTGRDAFALTGSPPMDLCLNLGMQLHHLSRLRADLFDGESTILPWPQYWAWLLSGVMASEVTSLGCHSDLWRPLAHEPSELAKRRGWARMLGPLRHAGDVLGTITEGWVERTGLPHDVKIYCGIHDSNAALLAARGFPEIANFESTVLSTGTWFVAMRTPAPGATVDFSALPEDRDCLVNVDSAGRPVLSSRFMGGREVEQLIGIDTRDADLAIDRDILNAALPEILSTGIMVLPTMAPGFGPFATNEGRWIEKPASPDLQRATIYLYLALVADVSLDLIGARERILVEGRFADAELFVRALAALRPQTAIYASNAHNDVSYGARRLIDSALRPSAALRRIDPLSCDLAAYKARWHATIQNAMK
jgi:sugar (pentulose or hexulose) kinase